MGRHGGRPSPKDEHLFSNSCTPVFLKSPHCLRSEIFHERLKFEERSFTVQPAAIPDELPAGTDYPVTRDDNRDRISPVRQTNSPRNISHFFRLGFVGNGCAKRDIPKFVPDANLECRSMQKNRNIKVLQIPPKILVQLLDRLLEWKHLFLFRISRVRGDIFIVDESQANKS